jgi:hypothetical protein
MGTRGKREHHVRSIRHSVLRPWLFTQVMRTGYVKARKVNQIMPWLTYKGMTDQDLAVIFAYVKTFRPVRHHVDNSEPATYCKLCRQVHGGGIKTDFEARRTAFGEALSANKGRTKRAVRCAWTLQLLGA